MNNNIKKLYEDASLTDGPTGSRYSLPDELVEKFAELIVRECVGITDDLVNRNVDGSWTSNELYTDYNGALFEVKRRIQEHFGVEE